MTTGGAARTGPGRLRSRQLSSIRREGSGDSQFSITSPANGAVAFPDQPLTLSSSHSQPEIVSRVSYYLDDVFVGAATEPPYAITLIPSESGQMTIRAVAETAQGNSESSVTVTVQ